MLSLRIIRLGSLLDLHYLKRKSVYIISKKDCIELNRLLVVPNATRWNSVYDAVTNLLSICSTNKDGLQSAGQKLDI